MLPFLLPELEDLRTRSGVFEDVSVVFPASVNLTGAKQPERLELLGVSPNYFSMLGTTPQIGRLFGPQDFALGFAPAVVISDGLWRRSYGADPKVLGFGGQGSPHAVGTDGCCGPDCVDRVAQYCQLVLARASGRRQEMAVRCALGANRRRMVRQMLTESMLLSVFGGLAGVVTALAVLGFILRVVPANIPRLNEVRIDWAVLAFALLISVLAGLVFGLAPAIHSARSALSSPLREGARGSGYSTKTGRLRDALIVSELAFAVVLWWEPACWCAPCEHCWRRIRGFNPSQVITANIWLPVPNHPPADPYLALTQQPTFNRELLRRMKAIPGVDLAAITSALPINGQTNSAALIIEDRPVESSEGLRAEAVRVSPDYFRGDAGSAHARALNLSHLFAG